MIKFVDPELIEFSQIRFSLQECFESKILTNGKYVAELEQKLAEYFKVNTENVVCINSATIGLMFAIRALGLAGKTVGVPALGFMADVNVLLWNGCDIVFIDIDPDNWNLSVGRVYEIIEMKEVDAILAVHLFGTSCDVGELVTACGGDKKLIFDSAHALGAGYVGLPVAKWGDISVFSLGMQKILPCGEGGVVVCKDKEIADKIRQMRNYGNDGEFDCEYLGLNGKMLEMTALLGLKQLPSLKGRIGRRNYVVGLYKKLLVDVPEISFQKVKESVMSSFCYFVIKVPDAFMLGAFLLTKEIETRVMYPVSLNRLKIIEQYQKCEIAEEMEGKLLALPMNVTDEQVKEVVDAVKQGIQLGE